MNKKEDIAGSPIYRQIARNTLRELHENLMKSLYGFLSKKDGKKTLVIAGQGPEVVPFSRNLDLVEKMVGNGNIAMFDYNPDIVLGSVEALVRPRYDDDEVVPEVKKQGIFAEERNHVLYAPSNLNELVEKLVEKKGQEAEKLKKLLDAYQKEGKILIDDFAEDEIDLKDGNGKVIVTHGNLADKFKFKSNSVSAFDATLAIHHVTAYSQGVDHVIDEVYRVLEKGGMFHWGTGIVDMRYQEEKINRVAKEVRNYCKANVAVEDRRDPNAGKNEVVARAFYNGRNRPGLVPLVDAIEYMNKTKDDNYAKMEITKRGQIKIDLKNTAKTANELVEQMEANGFKQIDETGKYTLTVPIIDQGMQEDREGFLESVRNYYTGIVDLNTRLFASKPDVASIIYGVDNKEFGDASRGLIEYYTEPKLLMGLLQRRGFTNITYKPNSNGIWCNITAIKK